MEYRRSYLEEQMFLPHCFVQVVGDEIQIPGLYNVLSFKKLKTLMVYIYIVGSTYIPSLSISMCDYKDIVFYFCYNVYILYISGNVSKQSESSPKSRFNQTIFISFGKSLGNLKSLLIFSSTYISWMTGASVVYF